MECFNRYNLYAIIVCVLFLHVNIANGIWCYECSSTDDMTCGNTLADGHGILPGNCSSLQEPLYCIKMAVLFEGKLGTKRFCSARDFGNYCEMVNRPGDERLYRACIYTCSTNYCNGSNRPASMSSYFSLAQLTLLSLAAITLIS